MEISQGLKTRLLDLLGVSSMDFSPVSGGSINRTGKITTSKGSFFCKINSATKFPQLFQKEAAGLKALRDEGIIRIPEVICCLEDHKHQLLVMEWIPSGERTDSFWKDFGGQLARLHQCTANKFGFNENNYMGSVVQDNTPTDNWITFFPERRLEPLALICLQQQLLSSKHVQKFEHLYQQLPTIFEEEASSLVHGDLWSGNFMCNQHSQPVLIDPAVYYGHRSIDLGMTTLFGGFRHPFYDAYHYHFPFPKNYKEQWEVCNLYPLLIHLLLFGKSYLAQIEETVKKYQ